MSVSDARPLRGVLDTSTVIRLSEISDPRSLPAEPLLTAVTLTELSVGPLVTSDDEERAARQARLQQAEADFDPLPIDAAAARRSDKSPRRCRAGRSRRLVHTTAMIAASGNRHDPVYRDATASARSTGSWSSRCSRTDAAPRQLAAASRAAEARPRGFEPLTSASGGRRSIH